MRWIPTLVGKLMKYLSINKYLCYFYKKSPRVFKDPGLEEMQTPKLENISFPTSFAQDHMRKLWLPFKTVGAKRGAGKGGKVSPLAEW